MIFWASKKQIRIVNINIHWFLHKSSWHFLPSIRSNSVFIKYYRFLSMFNKPSLFCLSSVLHWLHNNFSGVTGKFYNLPAVIVYSVMPFNHLGILLA